MIYTIWMICTCIRSTYSMLIYRVWSCDHACAPFVSRGYIVLVCVVEGYAWCVGCAWSILYISPDPLVPVDSTIWVRKVITSVEIDFFLRTYLLASCVWYFHMTCQVLYTRYTILVLVFCILHTGIIPGSMWYSHVQFVKLTFIRVETLGDFVLCFSYMTVDIIPYFY